MILSLVLRWFPVLTLIFAVVVQELAVPVVGWTVLRPDLLLICLFYWRLFRPDRCGPGMAFFFGLVVDAISTSPMGLNAFTKTVMVLFVGYHGSRLRSADYILLLGLLFILATAEQVLQWGLFRLGTGVTHVHWGALLGTPIGTLLLAPLVTQGLILVHQRWLEAT